MGDEVSSRSFSGEDRQRYREKVAACLDVFERMLATSVFEAEDPPRMGMEVELNLVDGGYQPMLNNLAVLEEIADPNFQTEIGAWNIEMNVEPRLLRGGFADELETSLRATLNSAESRANRRGAHIIMVGILPTLMAEHVDREDWISPSARYAALNDAILAARGENIHLDIRGVEQLSLYASNVAPESACTSTQLHLQVAPEDFAPTWNAAQVLSGPQLALGANSPYFYGRELWRETRTELFLQGIDTRPPELRNQGVRPRVWFGERWITSIFDLFEENVRYFSALLPEVSDEDPAAVMEAGRAPRMQELRLHNGTIYRWNRPVYDVIDGKPHVRVENRVLPAGPTVTDMVANAVFYYGVLKVLMEEERPVWSQLSFAAASENFRTCARHGLDARVFWPGLGDVAVTRLLEERLIPMAHEGLDRWGVDPAVRDRYLGIIEGRVRARMNGAEWQVQTVHQLEERGLDRGRALTEMLRTYSQGMHANDPVHTWSLP